MKEGKLHKLPIRLPSAVASCTVQRFMDQSPILDVLDLATQLYVFAKFSQDYFFSVICDKYVLQ